LKRIAIIGLGLMGGSLAFALKEGIPGGVEVVGYSRRPETIARAEKVGAIDRCASDPGEAVVGADLVVIATPVITIRDMLQRVAARLEPGCIVTDTGSTKANVMRWALEYLPRDAGFVGGHPMTGKETSGIDEADADLFRGCIYCLTPGQGASEATVARLEAIVDSIGARPFLVDAEVHDQLVAAVSHLPMLLSAAFVSALAGSESWPQMSKLAARGFRDLSRLASGNPEMNRDICISNREQISLWMDLYLEELRKYRDLVLGDGSDLRMELERARDARERWRNEEGW
jgi:prephenate dehydrogenase